MRFILHNKINDIYLFEYKDYIKDKKIYNKYFMYIITKYNKKINIEKKLEEKYNNKIKKKKIYIEDKTLQHNLINIEQNEFSKIYNNLIDKLKIKL